MVDGGDIDAFVDGNDWLTAHYATHTFEVDFVLAGNVDLACAVVSKVYVDPDTIAIAEADLRSGDRSRYGPRMLTMASNEGKGWFSILMADVLDETTAIPPYIREAILFVRSEFSREIYFNMYSYRLDRAVYTAAAGLASEENSRAVLQRFRDGVIDLHVLQRQMEAAMPGDRIHDFFSDLL